MKVSFISSGQSRCTLMLGNWEKVKVDLPASVFPLLDIL